MASFRLWNNTAFPHHHFLTDIAVGLLERLIDARVPRSTVLGSTVPNIVWYTAVLVIEKDLPMNFTSSFLWHHRSLGWNLLHKWWCWMGILLKRCRNRSVILNGGSRLRLLLNGGSRCHMLLHCGGVWWIQLRDETVVMGNNIMRNNVWVSWIIKHGSVSWNMSTGWSYSSLQPTLLDIPSWHT